MTDVHEPLTQPLRWLDDPEAGAALRADLGHGAAATVTGIDYGATLTALRGAIAAQTASLPIAAAASSSGWSVGVKLAIGVLLVGGIAVWASRGDVQESDSHARANVELAPVVTNDRLLPTPEPTRAPADVRRSAIAPVAEPTLPDDETAIVVVPEPTGAEPIDVDRDRGAKPRKRTNEGGASETQDTAVTPTRATVDAPSEDSDRYVREARLVAQARRALADDPARALALTEQVEREFPNGLLGEERRALEIRALAALGKSSEAKDAAKAFLAEYPDGPQAAAVRRAIED
jgi:hypothetical protein